ncbi:hypothetical protein [Flavobacterium sp.]|uniref:hypothetical protein n=1 Tax=Flavobacterium sp. TaxID=239 RepID=UPI003BDA7481
MIFAFRGTRPIAGWSYNSNKSILIPQIPKSILYFENTETGIVHTITDLERRLLNRKRVLTNFKRVYSKYLKKGSVTVLLIAAELEYYKTASDFIERLTIKFKRKSVNILGYYWQIDVGEKDFKPHYHFIVVVNRLKNQQFKEFFQKKENPYEVELCDTLVRFTNYLKKKEVYCLKGKRSFSNSKIFKIPKDEKDSNKS